MPRQEEQEEQNEELAGILDSIEYVEEDEELPDDSEIEEEEDQQEEEDIDPDQEEPSGEEESDDDRDDDFFLEDEEEEDEDSDENNDDDEESETLVGEIQKNLGFEFDQEFEDTEEGLQQLVEASSQKLAQQEMERTFEQFPEVKELYEYRRLGGDPDKFMETKFPEVDFQEVEFQEEDSSQHEMLVRRELSERGYNQDEIEAELEDYKNGGILRNKAERALSALKTKQKQDKEQLLEEQREQFKEQQEQVAEYWNGVKKKIKKNSSFNGIRIPSKDKKDFFDYISKPVQQGRSQRDLDMMEMEEEERLALDYLIYKGLDVADLVDKKAKDKKAKTLKERINRKKMREKQRKSSSQQPDGADVELGEI